MTNNFLLALQLLTAIPIKKDLECEKQNFGNSIIFFPIIGLIIGLIQFLIYIIFKNHFSTYIISTLILIIVTLFTGAMHIDGLADTVDGLLPFLKSKEKRMEIMKDSRVGAFAAVAIVLVTILKILLISQDQIYKIPYLLVIPPLVGKFSIVFLCFIGKPSNPNGSGAWLINNVSKFNFFICLLITGTFSYIVIGIKSIIIIIIILFITILFYKYSYRKISGITGDNLGAINEICEIITYLIILWR